MTDKPKFGESCNGCGYCCKMEVCGIGKQWFGDVPAPCPALHFKDGRHWCAFVLAEEAAKERGIQPIISDALGIGKGCCADDPATLDI